MPLLPDGTQQPTPASLRLETLSAEHSRLREDFDTLCMCLEKHGVLKQSWLHSESPSAEPEPPVAADAPARSILDALEPEVLRGVLRFCCGEAGGAGRTEMLALKGSSSCAKASVEAVQADKVYAFGGTPSVYGAASNTAECFDPRHGRWEPVASMYFRRAGCVAGVLCGRVHVCGGWGEVGRVMETFNPRLQAWDTPHPAFKLSIVRTFAAAVVAGGRLYVCGGEDDSDNTVHRSVEFCEPSLVGGTPRGGMLPGLMQQPRRGHAMAALPGQGEVVMAAGGSPTTAKDLCLGRHSTIHASVEVLDLSGGRWQHVAPMTQPRNGHSLSACGGKIYALGGTSDFVTGSDSVECWHAQAGSWTLLTVSCRWGSHSSVPAGGRIYVLGGIARVETGTPATRRSQRLDPAVGKWEDLPQMVSARSVFCSVCVKIAALAI